MVRAGGSEASDDTVRQKRRSPERSEVVAHTISLLQIYGKDRRSGGENNQ